MESYSDYKRRRMNADEQTAMLAEYERKYQAEKASGKPIRKPPTYIESWIGFYVVLVGIPALCVWMWKDHRGLSIFLIVLAAISLAARIAYVIRSNRKENGGFRTMEERWNARQGDRRLMRRP